MADSPPTQAATTGADRRPWRRTALYATAITLTVVLASGATIVAGRLLTADPVAPRSTLDASRPAATPATALLATTRLAVQGLRRLVDPRGTGSLRPGEEVRVPLPSLPAGTGAVLLQLSLTDAARPGAVTLRSSEERTRVLRLTARGGQSSATVSAAIGPNRQLLVRAASGGRLQIDLLGLFEPARAATAGRVVATTPARVVELNPSEDGDRATIDLRRVRALRRAGQVSAVLIQVSADVGTRGGFVSMGPSARRLDQTVYWSATTGSDRVRAGLLVVPVRSDRIHVQYKAGAQLRADLVGFVTGASARTSAAGLVVPLPAGVADPVRVVTAAGTADVTLVPAGGIAGVAPDRVSAALTGVTRSGRTAFVLSRVVDGAVKVTSTSRGVVTLTTRVLVLR